MTKPCNQHKSSLNPRHDDDDEDELISVIFMDGFMDGSPTSGFTIGVQLN